MKAQADHATHLMAAIVMRAIEDAFGFGGTSNLERKIARRWLVTGGRSRGHSEWFQQVCTFAGLDPDHVQAWAQVAEAQRWPRRMIEQVKYSNTDAAWRRRKLREMANGDRP